MRLAGWLSTVLVIPLLLTGCGAVEPRSDPATETQSAEPAIRPTGPRAHVLAYRCRSGREGTILLAVPDPTRLAELVDRIQPCEYDHGLSEATLRPAPTSRG